MSLFAILMRGMRNRCPRCGEGRLLSGYVRPNAACSACGLDLSELRADDAPPYFTIFLVGHIVVPGMLSLEQAVHPEAWVHMALWVPLALALTLGLLRPIKGAVMAVLWRLRPRELAEEPAPPL